MTRTLTLLAPGLLAPDGAPRIAGSPGLRALLARARRAALREDGYEAALWRRFGLPAAPGAEIPVGAVTWVADTGSGETGGWWMRADPVHLRADRDRVLVFGGAPLDLREEEAAELVREITHTLGQGRWSLEAPCPQRWYLRLPEDPQIQTQPLPEVLGRTVGSLLPAGAKAATWQRLLTEIQMLLAGSATNESRQARGVLPVNSLWLWGAGRLPERVQGPDATTWGEEPMLRGLARLAGMGCAPCPADAEAWLAVANAGNHLAVLGDLRGAACLDAGDVSATARAWDENWLRPLLKALTRRRLQRLTFYGGDRDEYELTPAGAWRWWRRPRPERHP